VGGVQPITMSPSIIAGLRGASTYVAFGTGKYLEADDRAASAQQSFYAIYDNGTTTLDTASGTAAVSGRGRLALGTFTAATTGTTGTSATTTSDGSVDVPAFTPGRATSDTDTTQRSGWYFNYPSTGERQVSSAQLSGDILAFSSLIPGASGAAAVCSVSGGSGRGYLLNIDTGDGNTFISKVGILGAPIVLDLANTTEVTSNSTGRRLRTITSQVISQGSGGFSQVATTKRTVIAGRLSWRQINNYQDLKSTTP
jgi:type IV pilus assembly protein PilY1